VLSIRDVHDTCRSGPSFFTTAICQLSNLGEKAPWESVSFVKDRISR
jgi:hypothetical protein